jgi:hypothetical protein
LVTVRSAVLIKILMGVNLVSFANRRRESMEAREAADIVNDFGRDPVGEGREERVRVQSGRTAVILMRCWHLQKYNKELQTLLNDSQHDATPTAETGELGPGMQIALDKNGKKRYKLEELTRFTMVKRIW